MAQYKLAYSGQQIDTLLGNINNIFNLIYPVGSIYISVNNTNPGTLFGGTWQQIQDTFLLSAGSTYTAGSTGGEATHTLSTTEIPSHSHSVNQQYVHRLDVADTNYVNYGAGGSLGGWDLPTTTNNVGTTRIGIPAFNTNATGSDAAHNNMPPYLVVYMWKRVS